MFLWLFTEVFYKQRLASNETDKKDKDRFSLNILWIIIIASISLSIFAANIHFDTFSFFITNNALIIYLGLLLIFVGIFARLIIIKSLGKYFTVDVTIRKDHKIKKDGFYSILRHPSYAASLLTFVGLGLYLNNWIALAIAIIPPFFAFSYRINVEEEALTEQFGQEYLDYKKTTKKLIPYIY